MSDTILVLPGDGIGPEIVAEAQRVLGFVQQRFGLDLNIEQGLIGGASYETFGVPLSDKTLALAKSADAVLLGAVGGPGWDDLTPELRPEMGLLALRKELGCFANLRPAIVSPQLVDASSLKAELITDLNLMIVRELTGGIYFGEPRGIRTLPTGEQQGFNTLVYSESEVERIARVAFESAALRQGRLCSVDKANVLEASQVWRRTVSRLHQTEFADIECTHMYVDNAAMQLVRAPKQFDVILTSNMFGDILSDCAAMLTGSIGMLPSASINEHGQGVYEPIHGSAPDIAGQGIANPLATILSLAMMFEYSFGRSDIARTIENAVSHVLNQGQRTKDIAVAGEPFVTTNSMGTAVIDALQG